MDNFNEHNYWHASMSSQEYFSQNTITSSAVKLFADSRKKYHAKYIEKSMPTLKTSPAFKTGKLVHMLLLEPERAINTILLTEFDSKTKNYEKFIEEHIPGLDLENSKNGGGVFYDKSGEEFIVCSNEEFDTVVAMVNSARKHNKFMSMLENCRTEYSGFATCPITGQRIACRADMCGQFRDSAGWMCDVKTIKNLNEFTISSQIFQLNYHLQQAHYMYTANLIEPGKFKYFFFFFIEKDAPHECVLVKLELNEHELALLNDFYMTQLLGIQNCTEGSAEWSSFGTHAFQRIKMPYWISKKMGGG